MPKWKFKPVETDHEESNGFVNKNVINKNRKSILNDNFKYLTKEVIYSFNLKTSKCATTSNIQINEEYMDCLIDTGAFTSFISEDYCLQRNFIQKPIINRKNWVTVNGNPIKWKAK